jgi:hypothetical protein
MPHEHHIRSAVLVLWAVLICCVVAGSLLPAVSPVMVAVGRLHINDKVMHFGAYLVLSLLPVAGFRDRRAGLAAGLSMFLLGAVLEACQQFSFGRTAEFGDVVANGVGVSCGALPPHAGSPAPPRIRMTAGRPARSCASRGSR